MRIWRSSQRSPAAPGSLYLSNDLRTVMTEAEDQQKKLKDDYLSVEHFLLAMLKKSDELEAAVRIERGDV